MNNQETIDQINAKIKELQAEVDKLKAEPDTSELVFKPENGEEYEFIGNDGCVRSNVWWGSQLDFIRLELGNVFRVGTARNSAKYYFMNSGYDYWIPWSGQPKPAVEPKGLEFWGTFDKAWLKTSGKLGNSHVYRWKRSEQ